MLVNIYKWHTHTHTQWDTVDWKFWKTYKKWLKLLWPLIQHTEKNGFTNIIDRKLIDIMTQYMERYLNVTC
jgi:hypothetical protein